MIPDKKKIEKLMHLDEHGRFNFRNYVIVPYRHHQNKMQWKVSVTEWSTEDIGEFESCYLSMVGFHAKEVAISALFCFEKFLKEKEEKKKIEREIRQQQKEQQKLEEANQKEEAAS